MRSSNAKPAAPCVVPEISCGRVLASLERAHESTQLLHRSPDSQRFDEFWGSLMRRGNDTACPRHRVDATGSRGRRGGVVCGQQPENLGRLDLLYAREVMQSALSITSLVPNLGPVGTQITIIGTGFSPAGNTVHFGNGGRPGVPSTSNGARITYTIPNAVGPHDLNAETLIASKIEPVWRAGAMPAEGVIAIGVALKIAS